MPNIASVRKSEISRLARKEVKAELETTRSTNARQRAEIAALRRRIQELERTVAHMANGNARSTASPLADEATAVKRFSAKGLASQRRLLGLSAEDFGKLVGASALSIYKCESGKAVSVRRTHLEHGGSGDNDAVQLTNSWTRWKLKRVASAGATARS